MGRGGKGERERDGIVRQTSQIHRPTWTEVQVIWHCTLNFLRKWIFTTSRSNKCLWHGLDHTAIEKKKLHSWSVQRNKELSECCEPSFYWRTRCQAINIATLVTKSVCPSHLYVSVFSKAQSIFWKFKLWQSRKICKHRLPAIGVVQFTNRKAAH